MSFDLPHKAQRTAGTTIEPGRAYGFFTDTSVCIGCKACEVACKEWNQLPAEEDGLSGLSYDNTVDLSATTWRHVAFIEQIGPGSHAEMPDFQSRWLMSAAAEEWSRRLTASRACSNSLLSLALWRGVPPERPAPPPFRTGPPGDAKAASASIRRAPSKLHGFRNSADLMPRLVESCRSEVTPDFLATPERQPPKRP